MIKTMQAAAINKFGGPEAISVQTLPVPEIDEDEVLIRIRFAGVGQWDPFERDGEFDKEFGTVTSFPHVLGSDGTVRSRWLAMMCRPSTKATACTA